MKIARVYPLCWLWLAMLALGAKPVRGQSSLSVTVLMPVPPVFALTIAPISTPLGTPTWSDFTAGYKQAASPVTITARANQSYKVTISSSAATFNYSGSQPNPNKPRSDLRWALNQAGPYTALGTGGTVVSGAGPTNGTSRSVYYRTLWDLAHAPPGDYTLNVNFTISAP